MVLTPLIVILAQVALQSDLRSGCSSQVKRLDMARSTPPPFLAPGILQFTVAQVSLTIPNRVPVTGSSYHSPCMALTSRIRSHITPSKQNDLIQTCEKMST